MTGRERLKTAMRGGKPDRVPFMPQICFPHAVMQLEDDYEASIIKCIEDSKHRLQLMFEITKLYQSDGFRIQGISSVPYKVKKQNDRYVVYNRDTEERLGTLSLKTGGIEPDEYPIKCIEDVYTLKVPTVDELLGTDEFELYRDACKWAGEDFNRVAGISMALGYLFNSRGMENALFDLYDNEQLVCAILDKHLEIAVNKAKALEKCGIDTIYAGDPWSSCSVISPQIFEKYSFPFFKRFIDEIKPSGLTVYVHICGNINPIIERVAELGAHCMEPMDPLGGVSPTEFRQRVGDKTALMGGVNTVTLSTGTPDDVRKEALKCIEGAGKNGGYILAAGDMVPFETPRENIFAMMETAHAYKY